MKEVMLKFMAIITSKDNHNVLTMQLYDLLCVHFSS